MKKVLILILAFLSVVSCAKDSYRSDDKISIYSDGVELYIYAGRNEEDYLGKLNANKYDTESIWNKYGTYGSKYNSKSIWNKYSTYGNSYNSYSPFNKYSTTPPALRDRNGRFYGYFTCNKSLPNRANSKVADAICDHYEDIREDVSEWYDKLFR